MAAAFKLSAFVWAKHVAAQSVKMSRKDSDFIQVVFYQPKYTESVYHINSKQIS
jgi:hypothetical protein